MGDFLSNSWFFHVCVKCENDTKGRIRFCNGFDAFPRPLFVSVPAQLCSAVSQQQQWWHCWGDTHTEAAGSCFSALSLCCGCCPWSPGSSRTERWGFHFCPPTRSPPTVLLPCANVLLVLCTWWLTNPAPCMAFEMGLDSLEFMWNSARTGLILGWIQPNQGFLFYALEATT